MAAEKETPVSEGSMSRTACVVMWARLKVDSQVDLEALSCDDKDWS